MQKVVGASIADSLKADYKFYCSEVSNLQPSASVINPEALKAVVERIAAGKIEEVLEEVSQKWGHKKVAKRNNLQEEGL